MKLMSVEDDMYGWLEDLFPTCSSITGNGFRYRLEYINSILSGALKIYEVPTGTKAFDWVVPKEWNIRDAWIKDDAGKKIIDFQITNLHVVGYSIAVDKVLSLEELQHHLHSLPDQPTAIPYVTSFYEEKWGFCLSEEQRKKLKPGNYHVFIDSTLKEGSLTYGELILPGSSHQEILFSTYLCHPSMANNELSGPVVTTALARWISSLRDRRYTYRFVFIPETIGSIVYLSRNLEVMKENTIAGFVVSCVGDDRAYSYVRSRYGNTLTDKVAQNVLNYSDHEYIEYSFLKRGSDERQYCYPGIDLPVVSILRSKYLEYPEYHTSLDNLDVVSPEGLKGAYDILKECCEVLEKNNYYQNTTICEPQLGKRGLHLNISTKNSHTQMKDILNVLAYADGTNDLLDISNIIGISALNVYKIIQSLVEKNLMYQKSAEEVALMKS